MSFGDNPIFLCNENKRANNIYILQERAMDPKVIIEQLRKTYVIVKWKDKSIKKPIISIDTLKKTVIAIPLSRRIDEINDIRFCLLSLFI